MRAQNRIDRLVEKYSAAGSCTFTSAVERDPQTRKVVKVVKVLQPTAQSVGLFVKAFEQEVPRGNATSSSNGREKTLTVSQGGDDANRIYMLKYVALGGNVYKDAKVTIIVKYK